MEMTKRIAPKGGMVKPDANPVGVSLTDWFLIGKQIENFSAVTGNFLIYIIVNQFFFIPDTEEKNAINLLAY